MKRAGELLSAFFQERFDPVSLESGRLTAGLFTSWAAALKAANISAAADHSRIREFEHKLLVIEAEHPGWVQLLQTKQSQLLKHVQVKFPELDIKGVSFCLSREPISRQQTAEESTVRSESQIRGDSAIHYESQNRIPPESIAGGPAKAEKNEALYESMKEYKKIIQKRNKKLNCSETSVREQS